MRLCISTDKAASIFKGKLPVAEQLDKIESCNFLSSAVKFNSCRPVRVGIAYIYEACHPIVP